MPKYQCYRKECNKIRSEFGLFLNRRRPPKFENQIFCSDGCLFAYFENELTHKWRRQQMERTRTIPRPKIGTILMQTAFITQKQLDEAVQLQSQNQEGRLGEWLLRLGFVDEHQITAALAKQYGLPMINLNNPNTNSDAVRMIPGKIAKQSGLVPVGFDDDQSLLRVAVCAPVDFQSQAAIRRMVHKGLSPYIGEQSAIQQLWEKFYEPEDLDLTTIPTYASLDDLLAVGRNVVATAIDKRALDIQAELVPNFFWIRIDYSEETHHHFFRYDTNTVPTHVPVSAETEKYDWAV